MLMVRMTAVLSGALLGLGIGGLRSAWSIVPGSLPGPLRPAALLIAQACQPCTPGCFDPTDGCHPGNTNTSCGASGATCQSCGSNQVCNNQACCTKLTCASVGATCGSASDGCGGSLSCGNCAFGHDCVNGQCGPFDCSVCNCGCNSTSTACFSRTCGPNTYWDDSVCACVE